MSDILVIGRTGQVASELRRAAWPTGMSVDFIGRESLDLTRVEECGAFVAQSRPRLVVNAAAYNAVDGAESARDVAFAVNCAGPAALAAGCASTGSALVHLSSDYVFDGTKPSAYEESDVVHPLSVYGESKAAGESAVRDELDAHIILRTSWVFSVFGRNFVRTMLRLGSERERVAVVNDQHGCPTAAAEVARAVIAIGAALLDGRTDAFGTYHFCGAGPTTWYHFAEEIFRAARERRMRTPRALAPIASSEYPSPTRRPDNSVLDCCKIGEMFGVIPRPWPETLGECLDEIRRSLPVSA